MATTTMIHVRVNEDLKKEASQALESMGLSVSDAVRVFLTRIAADQAFPFAIQVPNADTQAAMLEARTMTKARFNRSEDLFDAIESK
jgi:DNA-damage-inducible protein J